MLFLITTAPSPEGRGEALSHYNGSLSHRERVGERGYKNRRLVLFRPAPEGRGDAVSHYNCPLSRRERGGSFSLQRLPLPQGEGWGEGI